MEVEAQCDLIRQFMVAIAPEIVRHSLENGTSMIQSAALTLEAAMVLSARYNELHETLTATPAHPAQKSQQKTASSTPGVLRQQARIPVEKSQVSDLRSSQEPGRPSPLSPAWRPPEHNR